MTKIDAKEITISAVKSVLSSLPWPGIGPVLNEILFDYRSRVKQNRLNSFTEFLTAFFIDNPDVDPQSLKTEEFSDLFESVVRRILQTKSKEKHVRFRNVLIRQIRQPHQDIENAETYLDLIGTLNETAIWILSEHLAFTVAYGVINPLREKVIARTTTGQEKINKMPGNTEADQKKRDLATAKLKADQEKVEQYNKQITGLQSFRKATHYDISASEFLYYKQTLYAKGLLIDKGFGTHGGGEAFQWTWITEFGRKFMEFLTAEI
jgi:hypothetical protein